MAAGSAPGCALRTLGLVCLFLKLDFISCAYQEIFGAMHGNVTLYTSKFQPFTEIIWKRFRDKVVEWDQTSEVEAFQSFQNRVLLDTVSGNLTITNLTKKDEGVYTIESPSVEKSIEFNLRVIAPPPPPSASCLVTTEGKRIALTCSVSEEDNQKMTFDAELSNLFWECPPTVQCDRGLTPSEVYVSVDSDLSQNVQCIISNPLFRRSQSISLSTCMTEDDSRHRYVLFAILPAVICGLLFLKCFLGRRSQGNSGT